MNFKSLTCSKEHYQYCYNWFPAKRESISFVSGASHAYISHSYYFKFHIFQSINIRIQSIFDWDNKKLSCCSGAGCWVSFFNSKFSLSLRLDCCLLCGGVMCILLRFFVRSFLILVRRCNSLSISNSCCLRIKTYLMADLIIFICDVFLSWHSDVGNSALSNSKQCRRWARLFFSSVLCNSLCRE